MPKDLNSRSRSSDIASWLGRSFWINNLLVPLAQAVPAALLITTQRLHDGLSSSSPIYDLIKEHPYRASIIAVVYLVLLNALIASIKRLARGRRHVGITDILRLFTVLEEVVGSKSSRFQDAAQKYLKKGSEKPAPGDIFREITQPDQQIALLNRGLYAFFEAINRKQSTEISTALVMIGDDGLPTKWFHYWPISSPPLASIADLKQEDSTVRVAVRTKRIVIVEDIKAESKKPKSKRQYRPTGAEDEEGSLICYPIIDGASGKIPYVVAVLADRKKHFVKRKKRLYRWILSHFEVRIRLEHSLSLLRSQMNVDN